jgi:L-ascorbate metabolism protein UlaG (beta-lactamase superfamily)
MRHIFSFLTAIVFATAISATYGADAPLSGDQIPTEKGVLMIHPINHATFVMQWDGKTVYVDPVGGAAAFTGMPKPDLILLTHMHPDHFDTKTLDAIVPAGVKPVLIVPKSVAEKLTDGLKGKTDVKILANGEKAEVQGIGLEAVAAYNTSSGKENFHPKGRDNGYVLSLGGKKIYIAGDTEDTPEMRAMKGIDVAFLPMNLPYTMSVDKAAEAIRALKPKIVYPYHYRSSDNTKADFEQLKKLMGADSGVEIRVRDWYATAGTSR